MGGAETGVLQYNIDMSLYKFTMTTFLFGEGEDLNCRLPPPSTYYSRVGTIVFVKPLKI